MPRTRKAEKSQPKVETKKTEEKVQQKKEKTQPIAKPKKFLKKSIDAIQRIERSKHQRIFLLQATRNESSWNFKVLGTSGSQYHVTISTAVHCTCIDFRMKKKPCKHIFFIVTQVALNEEILDYFKSSSSTISKAAYKLLDEQLLSRLKSRLDGNKKDSKDIDLKDDTDCTICFTEMEKETEDLQDCTTCKKYFHTMCLSAWKNHNPTCPLCRSALVGGAKGDPLSKVSAIKL